MLKSLLGTSRDRHRVACLAVGVAIAISAMPGFAHAHDGEIHNPLERGFWVGLEVISEISLASDTGDRFTPDSQFLSQLTIDEPHATTGVADAVSMLEAFSPVDAINQAEAILAELELARLLNNGSWLAASGSEQGADGRVRGRLLVTAAKAQADFAMINLRDEDGSFTSATPPPSSGGGHSTALLANQQMLGALSQLTYMTDPDGPFGEVYGDARFTPWFREGADAAFANLPAPGTGTIAEDAAAIGALVWYLEILDETDRQDAASDLRERADSILSRLGDRPSGSTATANAIEALSSAAFALDEPQYEASAGDLIGDLVTDIEQPDTTWTIREVAAVIGALNSFTVVADGAHVLLETLIRDAVLTSGLVVALGDPQEVAIDLGLNGDQLPIESPTATAVGSPALAAYADFEDGVWTGASEAADPVASMYLARVLLVAGSPPQDIVSPSVSVAEETEVSTSTETGIVIEIEATDFAFSPPSFEIPTGATVTLKLTNSGVVPHNIDLPELGIVLEAEAGETQEITFSAPTETATTEFLCNLPGHRESGMTGAVVVTLAEAPSTSTDSPSDAAVASSSLIPPESFGDSEARFNLGGLTIPFMGFLTLLLVGSVWALWRLTLALDDEPAPTATMTTNRKSA